MHLKIEVEREADGRWIAEVVELPGCMAYGDSQVNALAKAKALALRVLADFQKIEGRHEINSHS
jgi:predicted RNase H-like HicB family nuclease